ncbi:MAG: carbohydrate-binding protein [bacterium]|nr:carbohydrate-binding protein [bacterium]
MKTQALLFGVLLTLSTFLSPPSGHATTAVPGEDQWAYCGDMVTLDGTQSVQAETFHWEQIITGDEPSVTLSNPDPPNGVTTFTPPPREIGYVLSFRLTVTGPGGADSADTRVNARANNPPRLAPQNVRVLPLDLGPMGLGWRVEWDPVFDAEEYDIALKFLTEHIWLETISRTSYDLKGLTEGQTRTIGIRGRNKFGASDDPAAIADVSVTGIRNLAIPVSLGGKTPPLPPVQGQTYLVSHYDIAGMNNRAYDDHNDSWNGSFKDEDFWGYLWPEPLFFDHIVYFTGNMFQDGGWFTSLKVQYTTDGVTWNDARILEIYPEYDFTDSRAGKQPFTRYDIFIRTVRGKGIRIYGPPGGTATFTSIGELEVFGDQVPLGPVINAIGRDAEFEEGSTATLDGSQSSSTAGPIVEYEWEQVSGPPVTIQNANAVIATFEAPAVDQDEVLVFSLTVSDASNEDVDNDVRITVRDAEVPETKADAGPDQVVFEGNLVTLDGSASTSASGSLTYLWTQTGGTDVGATGSTTAVATFTAPIVGVTTEELTFRLQVDDGLGLPDSVSTDEVVVEVRKSAGAPPTAVPGEDQWVYCGDMVALDGTQSVQAETFHWEQIITGGEPSVTLTNPDPANGVTTFTPPPREIGYVLTFRLTVTGPGGADSADTHVNARANNPPRVAPQNVRVLPLDLGPQGLGFRLVWAPLFDAEEYDIGLEFGGQHIWLESIAGTSYVVKGLTEGQVRTIGIRGRNKFGASDAPGAIADVSVTAMRNLGLPASLGGKTPPLPPVQGQTYVVSHYDIAGMNNRAYDDHNDSWNGSVKDEDFWGYLWSEPFFFDHIVYFTGDMFTDGGWFTSLKVQYSTDGVAWNDAPILEIYPEYDFTDDRTGKQPFARYDIFIPVLRGKGIRIHGTPGGTATFTSIAELEVFGDQTRVGPVIQAIGLDAEFNEGTTATLDGSHSSSTAGPIALYEWEQVSGPAVTIQNAENAIATFQTPMVDQDEVLVFSLTVSDGTNQDVDDDVRITVRNVELPQTKADAGPDQVVFEGNPVTLDGSASTSASGSLTYLWTQTGGIDVGVTGSTTAVATFTAPIVGVTTEELTFRLQVDDGLGQPDSVSTDDVRILVKNLATTAVAGPDLSVQEGSQVTLDGTASLTTTGYMTYLWTQVGGMDVGVTGKTTPTVAFAAPTIWAYEEPLTFRLDVNDGAGGISSDEVVVTVRNALAWPVYPLDEAAGTFYLKNLLHLGQNPTDRILAPLDINSDPLAAFGGQARQKPYPELECDFTGTGVTVTRNPMRWTPIFDETGFFGDEAIDDFQQVYHIYILSSDARDARFHFRHDDEIRVWNNGVLVINRDAWDVMSDQTEDFVLEKGLNSITLKFQEAGGPNHLAVGITTLTDESWGDLLYSLGPSLVLTDVYASRSLPNSFEGGETVTVDLAVRVNPANVPVSVTVVENIPAGVPEGNVSAPGAIIAGGNITWILTGALVKHLTLSYSLTVPAATDNALRFAGTVTFGATTVDIQGDKTVYPVPAAPRGLTVGMLQAAHLSWAAPLTEGTASYNVYRSAHGGAYALIATTTSTSYTDKWVVPGDTYAYQVSAVNAVSDEGPASVPTAQVSMPTMEVRESEDFDYGSGQYPGFENCPAANEAPSATDLDSQYDFFHPNIGGPNEYRPANVPPNGIGIETVEETDDPGVFHTNIGWVDVGSWYRYTYNVPKAGWIKLEFRVASPLDATLAAYWDETFVGMVSYNTGNWHIFTWALMEDQIQTTAGVHTLRVQMMAGGGTLDKYAIQWDAASPARQTIWEDNFDSYSSTADVFSPTVGKWTRGNTTNTAGSWTLWDTAGPNLGNQLPNIAGMEDKYMISDSDLSGAGVLLDEEMISPEVDCTDWTKVRLDFNKNYRMYDDPDHLQIAEVDIRFLEPAPRWSNWVRLMHLEQSDVDPSLDPPELSASETRYLSAYDGKIIQFRWHFYDADWDYWFAVDKIRVSGVPAGPPPPQATIGKDGDAVSLGWEEFGDGQYTVESTDDLLSGNWLNPPGTWPTTSTTWTDEVTIGPLIRRFYRIESAGIYTKTVGLVQVEAPRGALTMISVPVAAADNRLNGEPGCIGDMIKENLVGGTHLSVADLIYKWDAAKQRYISAFLADGMGEAYDGKWFDPDVGELSTMTLDAGEAFWLQRR